MTVVAEASTGREALDLFPRHRETQVLRSIAAGKPNKLVADQLSVTEDTVKAHVKSILSKLGANDPTHAVTIAVRRGIIEL